MSENKEEEVFVAVVPLNFAVTLAVDTANLETSIRKLLKEYFSGMLMVVDDIKATIDVNTGEFSLTMPEKKAEMVIQSNNLGVIN